MTAKYEKQILKLATDRGWKLVRKGGHQQLIIEYPETGARAYLFSSPKSRPSPTQIMAKLSGMERSTRTKTQLEILEWICNWYGIPADGEQVITDNLAQIVRNYLGREPKDKREADRYKNAIGQSNRVWMLGYGQRGIKAQTPRLFLGRDAILDGEWLEKVREWPQVNGVFDDIAGPQVIFTNMRSFVKARGFTGEVGDSYVRTPDGRKQLSLPEAYKMAQSMPEIQVEEPQAPPEPIPSVPEEPETELAPPEPSNDGIIVVTGEDGVHTEKWLEQNEQAAKTVGLPVELVTALRAALQIDNTNVISGLDMVRDALTASIDAATVLVRSLEDLDAAIELIKVEG